MIDFDRFWADFADAGEDEDGWKPEPPAPGVSEETIAAWERQHGVTMPEPLRTALRTQNGGRVRNTSVQVYPIEQMVPADEDFWEWAEIEEDEAPDHTLMFLFGDEGNTGATFLMNFNANGPKGAPSVYIDHHGETTYLVHDTIAELFEAELAADDAPSVSWDEAESSEDILARETIDLSGLYDGEAAALDQILAGGDDHLVLFTREQAPDGERLARTTLPLPLDSTQGQIRPLRPEPNGTFALHIQPAESDGIVMVSSATDEDGRWKNATAHGVPIYVNFESIDRDRLTALQLQLFGREPVARIQAKQDEQAALEAMLNMLPPEQRAAAMMQAVLGAHEETKRRLSAEIGPPPEELAQVAEAVRLKMKSMMDRARKMAEANPVDPEIQRKIDEQIRNLRPE